MGRNKLIIEWGIDCGDVLEWNLKKNEKEKIGFFYILTFFISSSLLFV